MRIDAEEQDRVNRPLAVDSISLGGNGWHSGAPAV
jgi:hypothetical protein